MTALSQAELDVALAPGPALKVALSPAAASIGVKLSPAAPVRQSNLSSPEATTLIPGVSRGPRGLPGPPGASGAEAEFQTFVFATAGEWVCTHNLGRLPVSIVAYDGDGDLRPLIPTSNPDLNTTVLSPNPPLAGSVMIV